MNESFHKACAYTASPCMHASKTGLTASCFHCKIKEAIYHTSKSKQNNNSMISHTIPI